MICRECCTGDRNKCHGRKKHPTYCDNQHDHSVPPVTPRKVDLSELIREPLLVNKWKMEVLV